MKNPFSLEGKTILVTGAASGIGRATAIQCAEMGAKVILVDLNEQGLKDSMALISRDDTEFRALDLTDLEKLIGKKRFGELCNDYIEKPQGKPTLAPESDKRPAFNAAADDFSGIDV